MAINIEFTKRAIEAQLKSAEEAECRGNASNAISYYKKVVDSYKKLAGADTSSSVTYETKAMTYENKIAELASGNIAPVQKTSATAPAPAKAASAKPAPVTAAPGNTAEKKAESDYEGYSFTVTKPNSDICLDDLVGLDIAKREIYDKLIKPLEHPEIYIEKYHLKVGTNMILYGPPGTGKTSFAKAVANQVGYPFIAIAGSDVVDKFVGETAKKIREIFEEVRRFIKENKTPVVLFLDEFDEFTKSGDTDDKSSSSAVPELKRQMDGVDTDNSNLVIIAATNYIGQIESAIKSRMECIEIPLPDLEARKTMISKKLKKAPLDEADRAQIDVEKLAAGSEGLSGRDITRTFEKFIPKLAARDAYGEKIDKPLTDLILDLFKEKSF